MKLQLDLIDDLGEILHAECNRQGEEAPQWQECPTLITTAGAPVGNNEISLSAGERAPPLQHYQPAGTLALQKRKRIQERHSRGFVLKQGLAGDSFQGSR